MTSRFVSALLSTLTATSLSMLASESPAAPPAAAKTRFAALSLVKKNGAVYGWANDHESREAAEERALEECSKRLATVGEGGACSVVLSFSGTACGVYKTVSGKGTAYGWGVAADRPKADAIASAELAKRSKGTVSGEHVWACNSPKSGTFAKFIDDRAREYETVTIGTQVWIAENLADEQFRNGEPIAVAKSKDEFFQLSKAGKPAIFNATDAEGAGNTYNRAALVDPRGICPDGFHAPSAGEWTQLIRFLGGERAAGPRLQKPGAWTINGSGATGFAAEPFGYEVHRNNKGEQVEWWTTTNIDDNKYSNTMQMRVTSEGSALYVVARISTRDPVHNGSFVRCLKG